MKFCECVGKCIDCDYVKSKIEKIIKEFMKNTNNGQDNQSVKFASPDYSNIVKINDFKQNANYTMTQDGYIQWDSEISGSTGVWARYILTINGTIVRQLTHSGLLSSGTYIRKSPLFPVKAGDVVSATIGFQNSGTIDYSVLNFMSII